MVDTSPFIRRYYSQAWALNPGGLAEQDPEATRAAVLAWLAATRPAAGPAAPAWRVVVGHHPLASNGGESREGGGQELAELVWLKGALLAAGVPLYLNGHEHDLELVREEGARLHMVTSGAGSDVRDMAGWGPGVEYQAADQGFVAVRLFQDAALLEFYVAHGEGGGAAPDHVVALPRLGGGG
jgi:hypothetical protein